MSSFIKQTLSKQGQDFIARHEGCKLIVYKDVASYPTIGVGHLITGKENPPITNNITYERAMQLLQDDTAIAMQCIYNKIKIPLNQHEFDALVSFIFNIGVGAFSKSTLLAKLNSGLRKDAANQFLVWNKAGGKVVQGLINRRQSEKNLFLNGVYE